LSAAARCRGRALRVGQRFGLRFGPGSGLRSALVALAALACVGPGRAADVAGQSMLILDASGSMWGQVGGKAKIEIARAAVAKMLATWPQQQALGLMSYGHRRKGDCADIQVLSQPKRIDPAGFARQVNALQPKGMTPITDAVRQAAEMLKFTEQKATVILVSDGEETCNADPCALGQELKAAGIDFKAHVVGFDLPEGKARAQLQCLARNTGGRYVEARDAAELNQALGELSQVEVPKPAVVGDLLPPMGCVLYELDDFKGASIVLGESGYADEMPPGWDNRARSLKCSARSGLYLYNDKAREGEYLMIEDGGIRNHLGAVASSYIYFGTYAVEPDKR
jgi:hypothetical protein